MVGAKAVFSDRIHKQIVRDRISSVQLFRVKTNVLCALQNFTVWEIGKKLSKIGSFPLKFIIKVSYDCNCR